MAGPGGGPPRKSHTKSRKGCKTCKKRHIRCDESFPQCRNCTKHNCRCDYMDLPGIGDEPLTSPGRPDLLITPEIQHMLDQWKMTGQPPLRELDLCPTNYWTNFSTMDLRLIHHIATLAVDIHRRAFSNCTVWAPKMPTLLKIAVGSDFVMSAILAMSASHLAWQTEHPETENLAYHHRGIALKGLHQAIGAFSRHNSEAILAASLLLYWQATEWRSWASLQQGIATVLGAMQPWAQESELAAYLQDKRSLAKTRTPSTPGPGGPRSQYRAEDFSRLSDLIRGLHNLRLRLTNNPELLGQVEKLTDYLDRLVQEPALLSPEKAFERLQDLKTWIFWLPLSLCASEESVAGKLAVQAHFYAAAIATEPILSQIDEAYLGNMSVSPLENIQYVLSVKKASRPQDTSYDYALGLIDVPMRLASEYRTRQRVLAAQNMVAQRASPSSPFAMPQFHLASTPELPAATVYSNSPMQSPRNLGVPTTTQYFPAVPSGSSTSQRHSPQMQHQMPNYRHMRGGSPLAGDQHLAYPVTTSSTSQADYGTGASYYESTAFNTLHGDNSSTSSTARVKGKDRERQE